MSLALISSSIASAAETGIDLEWKALPALPDPIGFAAPFAGVSDGALIVGGGANFPKAMPWEGGQKVWYDSAFVLLKPEGNWLTGFKLPRSLAYGVSVSTPRGVLCAGGGDATQHFADVFLLQWTGGRIEAEHLPSLPARMANGCGALVGNTVYIAGGTESPAATTALHRFWSLELSAVKPQWRELEPWPGPGRMLPVAGSLDGKFYLFSGGELDSDKNGKPVRRHLRDAYCFERDAGWKRLADLPRAAVAAPSPAIVAGKRMLVVSGDDGAMVNFEPKSKHPGFPKNVLSYDPQQDRWEMLPDSPLSRATVPMVEWQGRSVIVNGEVRPGVRTPEVWSVHER